MFPPSAVLAARVAGSAEWQAADGRSMLVQEGEAAVHATWRDTLGMERHAGYLGGHTSAGWAPRPSGYATASLAASSLLTLQRAAGHLGLDPDRIEVEVAVVSDRPTGGKEASQEAAAEGRPDRVRWRRAGRAPRINYPQPILATLATDPIARILAAGDLLADDRIVVDRGAEAVVA
jgi:hypothetical protein